MVVVNIASFVTGIIIERRSQFPRTGPMSQMFGVYAQSAVEVLERDGKTALAAAESMKTRHTFSIFFRNNSVPSQLILYAGREALLTFWQASFQNRIFPDRHRD